MEGKRDWGIEVERETSRWNWPSFGYFYFFLSRFQLLKCLPVMRKDAVYTLLLNVTLFPGMHCTLAQDPRYMRFSAIENGVTTIYTLKVSILLFRRHQKLILFVVR